MTATTATAPARLTGLAFVGWVGFILLLVYATFLGGGYVGTQAAVLRMLTLLLVALTLGIWAFLAWRAPRWRPSTAIWPAIILPLAALAITTFLSPRPRLGLEYLAWAVLLFGLYLLLVRVMALPAARLRIGSIAALLGFIVGIAYVAIILNAWLEWWELLGHLAAPMLRPSYAALTFGGPNIVAPVMVLLTAAAFGGISPHSRTRRVVLGALAAVMLLVVLLAASRASWLALGFTILLVGAALLVANHAQLSRIVADRRWRRIGIGVLLLAVPVLIVVVPAILGRLAISGDGGRGSYFAAALRMFDESPLIGVGTGTWAVRRAAYTEPGETDWYVNHAHNVYLQTVAEMGLVGALAGIIAIVAVGWLVWRGLRAIDRDRRRWAWGALFGLVYLSLHSMLDFYANMPVVMLVAAIPVAVLDATSDKGIGLPDVSARASKLTATVARGALWLACAAAVVVLFRTESIASTHQDAVLLTVEGDWQGARTLAFAAAAEDPEMIPYLVTQAAVASALGEWHTAHDAYQGAASTDDLPANWLGLAQAQIELDLPPSRAVASLERALRLGDRQPAVAYAAGHLYDRLGMREEADSAYRSALVRAPSLAADPSWTSRPELATRFPETLDGAIAQLGSAGWLAALMAGDIERARTLSDGPLTESIIDAWTGSEQALSEIQAIADEQPRNGVALAWAARLSDRAEDAVAADRYRRLGTFIDEVGAVADEVRVGGVDPQDGVVTAVRTDLYGQMLYRRPLPVDLLAPGLPRLVYLADR